jgi:DNA-binding NarL/FixJ family response regulator
MARFFIADDSALLRKCLRQLIEQNPDWHVCGEASDGRDAVEKVQEVHPDLVILDFSMPVMNGIEAASHISKLVPDVPILLCTLYLSGELVHQAQHVGICGAVSKNKAELLIEGIRRLLQHEKFYPSTN